jgi:hypothetical protein
MFFYFLKLFLRSAYQNDPKHKKKINILQKKKLILDICDNINTTPGKIINIIALHCSLRRV